MWKYIVTWCLVTAIQDPCPDAGKLDEFLGFSNNEQNDIPFKFNFDDIGDFLSIDTDDSLILNHHT